MEKETKAVKFKRFISRIAAGLALLSIGGTASAKAPAAAQPALWEVSDADTTVYLFGTIHLLPDDYRWRSDTFDKAAAGSHELVVETIVDDKNPAKLMSALAGLAFTKGLPPLVERVPEAKRPALAAAVKKSGFPPAALDQMETWAAAFMLLGAQFKALDLKAGEGVEMVLRGEFTGRGKPIGELETNAEQLGYFDRLSEKAQRTLLEGAIEDGPGVKDTFNAMLSAWSRGDVRTIAEGVQPRSRRQSRAGRRRHHPAQRQLDQLGRGAHGQAGHCPGRGRRRPPRRQALGHRHARAAGHDGPARPIRPVGRKLFAELAFFAALD